MTTAEQPSDTTAPAAEPDPCEYLPWDSRFFGFETGRVLGDTLTADRVRQIDRWCGRRKVVCLYFLSRGDDAQTRALADLLQVKVVENAHIFHDSRIVVFDRDGKLAGQLRG